jgi:Sigma-54 interaction domain
MENTSSYLAQGQQPHLPDPVSSLPDHYRLARAAHVDLLLMGMPRVNLLLIAPDAVVRYVLESLLLNLREPTAVRVAGQPLGLPRPEEIGTLVIHDAGTLSPEAQLALLAWLEEADGRVQIVTTSSTSLLPRVQCGAFIDTLYYRLNTVCVDISN